VRLDGCERLQDCMAHDALDEIVELPWTSHGIVVGDLLDRARSDLGSTATLELSREILCGLECSECSENEVVYESLGRVTERQARCPACGRQRIPHLLHSITGDEDLLDRSPARMGLPPFDLVIGRAELRAVGYLLAGDSGAALGAVSSPRSG